MQLGGLIVPIRTIVETRRDFRASITGKAIIIRAPHGLPANKSEQGIRDMMKWALKTYEERPEAFAGFQRKRCVGSGYTFRIDGKSYNVTTEEVGSGSHRIKAVGEDTLAITINKHDPRAAGEELIEELLAKYFAGQHLYRVDGRVRELNDLHFGKNVKRVKLKNTSSRWGSCSSKGNINLSSRLLLAPPEILDAVIIHELAHLVEANHSPRFWAEVARVLPDYREHDRWLNERGHELRFRPTPLH